LSPLFTSDPITLPNVVGPVAEALVPGEKSVWSFDNAVCAPLTLSD
jgi:hypothetical protein